MGLISGLMALLFGGDRNVIRETAEVFRENADAGAARSAELRAQAMSQFGSEFQVNRRGVFDRFMDGLNRLPRPALALGTLCLFIVAMVDPLWFAARMQGLALVPEPLWWLLGVIVSFFLGARHQSKAQDFQRDIGATMLRASNVVSTKNSLRVLREGTTRDVEQTPKTEDTLLDDNPALDEWRRRRAG